MKLFNAIAILGIVSTISIPGLSTAQASEMNSVLPNYAEGVKEVDKGSGEQWNSEPT
jgi:hypothetical protein